MRYLLLLSVLAAVGCAHRQPATLQETMPPEMKDGIRSAIKGQVGKISGCYNQAVKRKKTFVPGTVYVQWDINAVGGVENADVKQTSGDEIFDKCLVTTVQKIKFPSTPKDQLARVVFPFVFKDSKAQTK